MSDADEYDAYEYLVLRYLPDPVREEQLNVGVVLHCQRRDFLRAAHEIDPLRLAALGALDEAALADALRAVDEICAGAAVPGRPEPERPGRRFGWLAAPRSTALRPGPVHGGVTDDPAAELERLAERLVRTSRPAAPTSPPRSPRPR